MTIKLGHLALDKNPRIAVVVTDRQRAARIKALPADILEIRADLFKSFAIDYLKAKILEFKKTRLPLILTVRREKSEGGRMRLSNAAKFKIFQAVISLVDAVDIEIKSALFLKVLRLARRNKKIVIASYHNFCASPSEKILEGVLTTAKKKGADIIKIATYAKSRDDIYRLMRFTYTHRRSHLITMSLGKLGSVSRLAFVLAGSLLTYSSVDKPLAPGQVPLARLKEDLSFYYPRKKTG